MLGEVSGRVTAGVFHGQMVVPEKPLASNETVALHVYAHKDNSTLMVNGMTNQVTMAPLDASQAISDSQPPVIDAMYVNDEATFADGATVGSDAMLYVTASDNEALNLQTNHVENATRLLIDGGKRDCGDLMGHVTAGQDGKSMRVEYPLSGLAPGVHTLTFTACDLVGQTASRTITIVVGQNSQATLVADKLPVYLNKDTAVNFDVSESRNVKSGANYVVRVTDALGNLVWKTSTTSFPVSWNLTGLDGKQVKPGLYRYYSTYSDGYNYGGTSISNLIVLEPVKSAQ